MSATEKPDKKYHLIVNKKEEPWPDQFIDGAQILKLAGSPDDWVVNQIVPGGGEDPEIGKTQKVDLDEQVPPPGIKKFKTRKPDTSPGQ